jgi:hypothetical protein
MLEKGKVACLLSLLLVSSAAAAADDPGSDFLQRVRAYADAMIEHGRDVVGPVHSPLFAEALDRRTMRMLDGEALQAAAAIPYAAWGVRPHDRMLAGGNPQHCQNLYQILYALTEVTGEPRYAAEADASLRFFFGHCQSPATGLLVWGEHAGWDFRTEARIEKPSGNIHEFYRPWVLWRRSWELAPEACRRFALGLWEHQIGNRETGDFSRHASIDASGAGTEAPYARHGGFYIETWAAAYERTGDPVFLQAIETVLDGLERARLHEGGMLAAGSKRDGARRAYDVSLAVSLGHAAAQVPNALAAKMTEVAEANDRAFAAAHQADAAAPASRLWSNAYGGGPPVNRANTCLSRFRQAGSDAYRRVALQIAEQYRHSEIDLRDPLWPGTLGSVVLLMISAHELTGEQDDLDAAERFARRGIELFLTDGCPLPKASHVHDHYEAVTNGDTLMMALLRLWQVRNQPKETLSLIDCDR